MARGHDCRANLIGSLDRIRYNKNFDVYFKPAVSGRLIMMKFDHDVDAIGLNCPLPLLRLKKALVAMESGEVVRVLATDPAAHLDIGVYAEQTGHLILHHFVEDGTQHFYIRKK